MGKSVKFEVDDQFVYQTWDEMCDKTVHPDVWDLIILSFSPLRDIVDAEACDAVQLR